MFLLFRSRLGTIALSLFCLFTTAQIYAEQKKTFNEFDIHYIAGNTSLLTPAVAKAYKIQRSKSRGIVTIAIRNTEQEKAVEGLVRGAVKNQIGQLQSLDFTKISDQNAIYYLATYKFVDQEVLSFDVLVSPDGVQNTFTVDFKQQFFVE